MHGKADNPSANRFIHSGHTAAHLKLWAVYGNSECDNNQNTLIKKTKQNHEIQSAAEESFSDFL